MATLGRGLVNTILNAATATGAGSTWNTPLTGVASGNYATSFMWQVNTVGTFTALSVTLQGSLDGVNWTTLDTNANVAGGAQYKVAGPVAFLRANVGTFTGGTSVSVLLTIADV